MNYGMVALAAQAFNNEIEASTGVTLKPVARIEDWSECYGCLIGHVLNHPQQSSFERPLQMTTKIVARGEGWMETENTRYILGREAK